MNITTISLSYIFLGIAVLNLAFSLYFKLLVIRTSPDSKHRDKIIGNMKDPLSWRQKNNRMAYFSALWAAISIGIFIYLKFFYTASLVSIIYPFAYIAIIAISLIVTASTKKTAA